jgi:hypothetical protein
MLTNQGRLWLGKLLAAQISPTTLWVGLYSNAVTWTVNTLLNQLVEVSWPGYARQAPSSYASPTIDVGGIGFTEARWGPGDPFTNFRNSGSATVLVYGAFVVPFSGTPLLGGVAFPGPVAVPEFNASLSWNELNVKLALLTSRVNGP